MEMFLLATYLEFNTETDEPNINQQAARISAVVCSCCRPQGEMLFERMFRCRLLSEERTTPCCDGLLCKISHMLLPMRRWLSSKEAKCASDVVRDTIKSFCFSSQFLTWFKWFKLYILTHSRFLMKSLRSS